MVLIKNGESITIGPEAIQNTASVIADPEILNRLEKFAAELKIIAPKAKDFLYFSAVMMHAAEASLLDNLGKIKKDSKGNDISYNWDKKGDSWKWNCSDPTITLYRNSNRDIFPEEELVKAYKKWIGRPLCLDHQSNSVDMVRGIIVDTYYDYAKKRVIALCALDKINYPDLAHKVSTGCCSAVSMGTAVGRAICSDCGNVARTEVEYCACMKNKSCYGEINVDLNPIELSIVVNGADPEARIRHIVAAADSIATYVKSKELEISKLADTHNMVDPNEIDKILSTLSDVSKQIESLKQNLKKETEEIKQEEKEEEKHEEDTNSLNNISTSSLAVEIKKTASIIDSIQERLNKLQDDVNKLSHNQEGNNKMTTKTAYFQGGGGVNEPTPGKPTYPKEDSDSIRDHQDKQMIVQDTGPVDGMFPGDKELKSQLQRSAEEKARALKRQAALDKVKATLKEGYFQGGGGVNEPTPGKPKYPKEDSDSIRDKQDKQMVGAKPFPGVGKIDGLYGDDEKTKQMLSRAKLTAKFIKAAGPDGSDDKENSRWTVFADNKLVLTGTVKDIAGAKADSMYNVIATKEFGNNLINTIRNEGLNKAATLFKAAQTMPPVAPPTSETPALPPDTNMPPEMPEESTDEGGAGDKSDNLDKLWQNVDNALADLREATEALNDEDGKTGLDSFEGLSEDQPAEGMPPEGMPPMPPEVKAMLNMRKKVSKALRIGLKKNCAELSDRSEELKLAKEIYQNKGKLNNKFAAQFPPLMNSVVSDSKETLNDSYKLMRAFVDYSKGAAAIEKKAQDGLKDLPLRRQVTNHTNKPGEVGIRHDTKSPALNYAPDDESDKIYEPELDPLDKGMDRFLTPERFNSPNKKMPTDKEIDELLNASPGEDWDPSKSGTPTKPAPGDIIGQIRNAPGGKELLNATRDVSNVEDNSDADITKPDGTKITNLTADQLKAFNTPSTSAKYDLNTKEGRVAYREELSKLAQTGITFSPMLDQAHPGGGTTTKLDNKPQGDLAHVEDLEEAHKKIMDVATAPMKIKADAEIIQQLVSQGSIDPKKDFPGLIANGLDPAAVKYWKELFGEGDSDCKQFAGELVQEYKTKKASVEKESFEVKLARAYDLANDMVRKGMIADNRSAVKEQVNELMNYNDDGFASMQRFVERQEVKKTASAIPSVGMTNTGGVVLPPPQSNGSDFNELDMLWAGRKV